LAPVAVQHEVDYHGLYDRALCFFDQMERAAGIDFQSCRFSPGSGSDQTSTRAIDLARVAKTMT